MTTAPCRVCDQFKSWSHEQSSSQLTTTFSPASSSSAAAAAPSPPPTPPPSRATFSSSTPSANHAHINVDTKLPCPPDSLELGSSTWTFLHTMASYYPDQPTQTDRHAVHQLMQALGQLYPCSFCSHHLRHELSRHPARTENRSALERWLCDLHNEVNERLGKSQFDCSRARERWRDGPADGSCNG